MTQVMQPCIVDPVYGVFPSALSVLSMLQENLVQLPLKSSLRTVVQSGPHKETFERQALSSMREKMVQIAFPLSESRILNSSSSM